MPYYVIAYDLDKPGQDYSDLYSDLESIGAVRIQESVWAVKGNYEPQPLNERLQAHLDTNDRLFVGKLNGYFSVRGMAKLKDL